MTERKTMQEHHRNVFTGSLSIGFLAVFGVIAGYGQNIVAVGLAGATGHGYNPTAYYCSAIGALF